MTLQATGPISLTNLQTEFGGTPPVELGEFYQGSNPLIQPPVPTSGTLSLGNFLDAKTNAKGNVTLAGTGSGTSFTFVDNQEDANRHFVVVMARYSSGSTPAQNIPTINGIACQTITNIRSSVGAGSGTAGVYTLKMPTGTGVFTLAGLVSDLRIVVYRVTGCVSMAVPVGLSTSFGAAQSISSSSNGCFFGACVNEARDAPLPFPQSSGLTYIDTIFDNSIAASNATTGPTQVVSLTGDYLNVGATFAYDIY